MMGSDGLDLPITERRFRDLNCELFIALIFQTILPYPVDCTYPMTMYFYSGRERGIHGSGTSTSAKLQRERYRRQRQY
jgi:hypothetical protein